MSTHRPSLWRVLSKTSRIITAHFRHFFALSALFLLPPSVAVILFSFLLQPNSFHQLRFPSDYLTPVSAALPAWISLLLFQLLYLISVLIFNLCAVSSITYSTFNGFFDHPLNLIPALKSIRDSFFPLLSTMLVAQVIMGLIIFAFIILVVLGYNGLALLGLEMDYDDQYFLVFVIVIATLLVGVLIYLIVEWYLGNAVVVLESKWGFAPLKRSSNLVKGMRGTIFLTIMFFAILSAFLSMWFLSVVAKAGGAVWWIVLQMVVFIVLSTVLQLYGLVANAIFYVHCKALHEESLFLVDDSYVLLPSDGVNFV